METQKDLPLFLRRLRLPPQNIRHFRRTVHTSMHLLQSIKITDSDTTPFQFHGNIAKRSLANIRRDNIRYRHSRKKIAKLYNNAIRRPLVNIELDHVAPPYLHILLGITKKHHDLLEDECHSLDKLIGQSLASSGKHQKAAQPSTSLLLNLKTY